MGRQMVRRLPPGAFVIMLLLFFGSACSDENQVDVLPEDLYGTWLASTPLGHATLTFRLVEGIHLYELRAYGGSFSDVVLPGSDILVSGVWSVTGNSLRLFDDQLGPWICLAVESYEITMSDKKEWFILEHLGEIGCSLARMTTLEFNSFERLPDTSS
ncbi:hypothetical protein ACFLZR_00975 [Candidatus Neomarinimicrobiota bacterium]